MRTGRRILVVEDDPDIRSILQITLERVSIWKVATAATGSKALELATKEQFDAAILDVMLPGLDGPALFAQMQQRESTKDLSVVFLTAKTHNQELRELKSMGARGVLPKPFSPIELRQQIATLFGWEADLSPQPTEESEGVAWH